jgi:hypothetical protein
MPIRGLNRDDLIAIAGNMRACDRREIFATRFDENADLLVDDLLAGDPLGAIVTGAGGTPIAVLGATEMWPGLWSVWMFATDRWPEAAREATRFARRRMWPALLDLGLRRAECRSAADHPTAHRWLRHLGGRIESIHPAYGKGGETFFGFVIYGERNVCSTQATKNQEAHNGGGAQGHGCRGR